MPHTHPSLEAAAGLDSSVHVIVDRDYYEETLHRSSTTPSVALSKRNLLALLHKLEFPGSHRTIIKPTPAGDMAVSVVSDEEAYRNRAPGPMHPDTEDFIRDVEAALTIARQLRTGQCKCGGCHKP